MKKVFHKHVVHLEEVYETSKVCNGVSLTFFNRESEICVYVSVSY